MQTDTPIKGRVNYEPNGWGEGPREHPLEGYTSFRQQVQGEKVRLRPESFNDHYSQARLFYLSQTEVERKHIRDALVFELSKCAMEAIRARMVSHLLNIDEGLARGVAEDLGIEELPRPAPAAHPPRTDLEASAALSIVLNGPGNFRGRSIGVLVSDGADAALLDALERTAEAEGAQIKYVAPRIGGFRDGGGQHRDAAEKVDGGPSVLFDAAAVVPGPDSVAALAKLPPARDFLADAFAHNKFIALAPAAIPLVEATGLAGELDEGCFNLSSADDASAFLKACGKLRHWEREL